MVNNDYTHWEMYAIGGSAEPTINSQGNRYLAPTNPFAKEVWLKLPKSLSCAHLFFPVKDENKYTHEHTYLYLITLQQVSNSISISISVCYFGKHRKRNISEMFSICFGNISKGTTGYWKNKINIDTTLVLRFSIVFGCISLCFSVFRLKPRNFIIPLECHSAC